MVDSPPCDYIDLRIRRAISKVAQSRFYQQDAYLYLPIACLYHKVTSNPGIRATRSASASFSGPDSDRRSHHLSLSHMTSLLSSVSVRSRIVPHDVRPEDNSLPRSRPDDPDLWIQDHVPYDSSCRQRHALLEETTSHANTYATFSRLPNNSFLYNRCGFMSLACEPCVSEGVRIACF